MLGAPLHGHELCVARLEERIPIFVDGTTLLGAHDVGRYPLVADGLVVWKGFRVKEGQQPTESVGLALVWRGREQQ